MNNFEKIKKEYERKKAWGLSSSINLYSCNPDYIRSGTKIKEFVKKLCSLLGVKMFGETQVVRFGENKDVFGYSMTQLIESSLVSAHFVEKTDKVFLDIFSCSLYDPNKAAEFAKEFFEARDYKLNYLIRV